MTGLLVLLGACATTDAAGAGEKGFVRTTTAIPPNHRQLVAARILTGGRSILGRISKRIGFGLKVIITQPRPCPDIDAGVRTC